jgi:hypothetical protein
MKKKIKAKTSGSKVMVTAFFNPRNNFHIFTFLNRAFKGFQLQSNGEIQQIVRLAYQQNSDSYKTGIQSLMTQQDA